MNLMSVGVGFRQLWFGLPMAEYVADLCTFKNWPFVVRLSAISSSLLGFLFNGIGE